MFKVLEGVESICAIKSAILTMKNCDLNHDLLLYFDKNGPESAKCVTTYSLFYTAMSSTSMSLVKYKYVTWFDFCGHGCIGEEFSCFV